MLMVERLCQLGIEITNTRGTRAMRVRVTVIDLKTRAVDHARSYTTQGYCVDTVVRRLSTWHPSAYVRYANSTGRGMVIANGFEYIISPGD